MFDLFKLPTLLKKENLAKAQILYKLLAGTMAIATILLLLLWIALPQNSMRWISSIFVFDLICLGLLFLNRKGNTSIASGLFISLCISTIVFLALFGGGIRSATIQIIPVVVLMAGLVQGWKAGLFTGLVTAVIGLGLVLLELWGILPANSVVHNSFSLWLISLSCIALLTLLQFYAIESLNSAFKKTQEELFLRTKAEEELRKNNVFRKMVFESSRIPIVVMDTKTFQFIECNQAAIDIYCFSTKLETIGKSPADISPPLQYDGTTSEEKAKYYVEKVLSQGEIVFEWLHQRPNGELWDAEVHLMRFDADNRQLMQFTLLDITERKKAEKSLKESESRIKSISNNFAAGMIYQVIINPDGSRTYSYLSDSVKKLYGISPEEAMANSSLIYNRVHKEDIEFLLKAENEATKSFSTFKVEARIINPDGEIRWSSFVSTPKLTNEGSVCWDGIEFIITDSKRIEEALKESEERFRLLAENSVDMISRHTAEGIYLYVSPACRGILGYEPKEMIGHSAFEFVHPTDLAKLEESRSMVVEVPVTDVVTFRVRHKNGNYIWFESTSHSIKDKNNSETIEIQVTSRNITERKLAEEALRISEEKFRGLFEKSGDALLIIENGKFIDCNHAAVEMLQYKSKEEFLYSHPSKLSPKMQPDGKDSLEKADEMMELAVRNGTHRFEWEHIKNNGEIIPVEVLLTSISNDPTKIIIHTVWRDITERKYAESALKESEEKYRYLMQNMNEVVMMVDNDDRVQFVNKKFTDKLGYTPDEIIGKIGYEKLLDPVDREIIIEANKKRIDKEISQYEICFIAKNGRKIDFLVSGAPIIDNEGKTLGSIGTMTDITERKLIESALKESEERYRKLVEAFPDIIMVYDKERNVLFANETFEKITGISPKDYNNANRNASIHPNDMKVIDSAIQDLIDSKISQTDLIEYRFTDVWGKLHWFSGRIAKLYMNGQIAFQAVIRDITEKKKIDVELEKYRNKLEILVKERTEELAAANEELSSINDELYDQREELQTSLNKLYETQKQLIHSEKMASLGILSAGIAHEINNPLNFIHGGILAIENYFNENPRENAQLINPYINAINVGVSRASEIVNSLNHYSRRDDLPQVNCNIHAIIDNCLVMLRSQLKNKVEINKQFTEKYCSIFGNEGKLHQAILNIISNAEQSIENKGTIEIETEVIKNQLTLSITDTGCGISKENLQKIFDPFFTSKDPGKGTGLGLAITYNIIHEHLGTIEFESQQGKGTKAIIKLPINKIE